MKLLDRYVSHAIGSLGEYERDVMYRSMIIRRITLFWGTEVAAAALAWTLPANLVWWALIVFFLPMFVSECGAWMYMRNRAVRPRSAGSTMTISEQLAYTAMGVYRAPGVAGTDHHVCLICCSFCCRPTDGETAERLAARQG